MNQLLRSIVSDTIETTEIFFSITPYPLDIANSIRAIDRHASRSLQCSRIIQLTSLPHTYRPSNFKISGDDNNTVTSLTWKGPSIKEKEKHQNIPSSHLLDPPNRRSRWWSGRLVHDSCYLLHICTRLILSRAMWRRRCLRHITMVKLDFPSGLDVWMLLLRRFDSISCLRYMIGHLLFLLNVEAPHDIGRGNHV